MDQAPEAAPPTETAAPEQDVSQKTTFPSPLDINASSAATVTSPAPESPTLPKVGCFGDGCSLHTQV